MICFCQNHFEQQKKVSIQQKYLNHLKLWQAFFVWSGPAIFEWLLKMVFFCLIKSGNKIEKLK